MEKLQLYLLMLLITAIIGPTTGWCDGQNPAEDRVKSAIILNMARFIDWPADAFSGESSPLGVCVLGRSPLGASLLSLQTKTVKGRTVTVRQMASAGDLADCQVAVVTDTVENRVVAALMDKTRNRPILTIGDFANFTQAGGMVAFFSQDGKIRFEINLAAVQHGRLKFSAQLLKLARIVRGGE